MKKWWIGLMMLLVLIFPTTAMALMTPCSNCHGMLPDSAEKEFDYENDKSHRQYVICPYCGARNSIGLAFHYTTQKATCTSSAWCGSCKSYFGNTDPNAHNWGSWTPNTDGKTHTRVCENNSDHTETRNHTGGGATCTTAGTCTDCGAFYNDPDNHAGPYTYSYESSASSATQHTVTETCTGCGQISRTYDEDHDLVFHDAQAPTCMEGGWEDYQTCKYCTYTTYTAINSNPNAHNLVQHKAKAPTCTEIGWDAYDICSRCDYSTYVEKSALGHDRVNHDAKAPTCTAIGWDAYQTCSRCDYSTYVEKSAPGHDRVNHDAQAPSCTEIGWDAYDTCSRCDYTTYVEKSALGHDRVNHDAQAPTCTAIGWDAYQTCSRCDYSTYVEKSALGHDRVSHDAQAPTCTEIGWNTYETCSRCDYSTYAELAALGHDYVAKTTKPSCTEKGYTTHTCTRCKDSYRDAYVAALGHWYGEWSPNADGTNSATCLRDAYEHTVDCARFDFVLAAEDVRTEFVLCPVCGEVSGIRLIDENGEVVETLEDVQLLLVENAVAKAVTERLPVGELVLRMGALPSGEQLMSVAFEWGGEPTQPTGQVKITLPAELLEGYALRLIAGDGAESELPLERDEEAETVSFVLDFTDSETPVQLMRVVPEV